MLAGREYTEKDLTEFIVGAVSEMDSPQKPNAEAKELDRPVLLRHHRCHAGRGPQGHVQRDS